MGPRNSLRSQSNGCNNKFFALKGFDHGRPATEEIPEEVMGLPWRMLSGTPVLGIGASLRLRRTES